MVTVVKSPLRYPPACPFGPKPAVSVTELFEAGVVEVLVPVLVLVLLLPPLQLAKTSIPMVTTKRRLMTAAEERLIVIAPPPRTHCSALDLARTRTLSKTANDRC